MKKQFCSLKKYTAVFSDFSPHCVCKFDCGQAFFYRKNRSKNDDKFSVISAV